jgi:hypothetical protein
LISKFAGLCTRCRCRFPAGTVIEWARNAGAVHANLTECAAAAAAPPPPVVTANLRAIYEFLIAAQLRGLKLPKVRFLAPGGGELRLSIAGRGRSVAPVGSIQVKVRDEWVGRVEPPDGRVVGRLANNQALLDTLLKIAADPAAAAKEYGALMCKCSFCGLALSDDGSVEVGYGPVCAKKWGLPHQPKGTTAVKVVA